MKKVILIMAMAAAFNAAAQTLSPKVTPTAGGYATGGGNSLSWTMGETFTPTLTAGGTMISQGEQQPEVDLRTGSVATSACPNDLISIPFSAFGYVDPANIFTAQLSDASGSFAAPVNIGTLSGTVSGAIAGTIPGGTATGTGYRIRVLSSHPFYTGSDNGSNVSIGAGCTFNISGTIKWENNGTSGVNNTTVTLTNPALLDTKLTNISGDFMLLSSIGGDMTVKPTKSTGLLDGVTAADASRIQQHITGSLPFTSPYKRIAADVNKSNTITSLDNSLLVQAVLGNPAALAIFNTSWRFVPTAPYYTFPNPLEPWGFPETRILTGVAGHQSGQDFTGVKIGDVNGTTNPASFPVSPLVWKTEDRVLASGDTFLVRFSAEHFQDLAAYQFALGFDPTQLQLQSAEPTVVLNLSTSNFGLYNIAAGEIRSVWANAQGVSLADNTEVFGLRFVALQNGAKLSDLLHLKNEVIPGYAYNAALYESPVLLQYKDLVVTDVGAPGDIAESFELLQNRPNPFTGQTLVGFVLPEACTARLRIFDVNGRLLEEFERKWPAGYNEQVLRLGDMPAGVLSYELTTPFGMKTKKMIVEK